jgi:isochorismate synthase EntC
VIKNTSRCGLGQTSPNPILTTLQNFRHLYEAHLKAGTDYVSTFDLAEAVKPASAVTGQTLAEASHE